jgi:hypothetical protein
MNEPAPKPKENLPGGGFLGWLGRQVAHVRAALKADVSSSQTIYRDCSVEERTLPRDPNVTLRRTVIDEVVVHREAKEKPEKSGD